MYHFPLLENNEFLREKFQRYYRSNKNIYTMDLKSREIGFIPFNGTMVRHYQLMDKADLLGFLYKNVPRHFYHSVAYYEFPSIRSMLEKKWKGAEFVFDLDADHIEGAEKMNYEETLARIKIHTKRLLSKFLLGYLEIDVNNLKLYFSGGRGYHIHISTSAFEQMNSDQRREISNLVRGEGLTLKNVLNQISSISFRGKGWLKNLDSKLTEELNLIYRGKSSGYVDELTYQNITENFQKTISFKDKRHRSDILLIEGIEKYPIIKENLDLKKLFDKIIQEYKMENSCEIDEPVSTDIHRLIRFPDSLHGKTGLRVINIQLDEDLNEFDKFIPLNDAVPKQFSTGLVKVRLNKPFSINFNNKFYQLKDIQEVPEDLSVFLIASGRANIE
jgi:DNA primase small subunit